MLTHVCPGHPSVPKWDAEAGRALRPVDDGVARSLLISDPRSLYHYWPDAPPDIRLLKDAIEQGLDHNKLLWQIVYYAPRESSAAFALVADNDFEAGVEIFSTLIKKERGRGADLLEHLSVGRPEIGERVIRRAVTDADIPAEWLLKGAIRCVESGASVGITALVLMALSRQGDAKEIVEELCEWASPTGDEQERQEAGRRRNIIGATLSEIMKRSPHQKAACLLLDMLWEKSSDVTADAFTRLVYNPTTKENRRDLAHGLLIGVVAWRSRYSSAVMLHAIDRNASRMDQFTTLVLDLADEDPTLAGDLAAALTVDELARSTMGRPTIVLRMCGRSVRRATSAAKLLLEMGRANPEVAAHVVAAWLASSYPTVEIPIRATLLEMVELDAKATADVLIAVSRDFTDSRASLSGLEKRQLDALMMVLFRYLPADAHRRIRKLL